MKNKQLVAERIKKTSADGAIDEDSEQDSDGDDDDEKGSDYSDSSESTDSDLGFDGVNEAL